MVKLPGGWEMDQISGGQRGQKFSQEALPLLPHIYKSTSEYYICVEHNLLIGDIMLSSNPRLL